MIHRGNHPAEIEKRFLIAVPDDRHDDISFGAGSSQVIGECRIDRIRADLDSIGAIGSDAYRTAIEGDPLRIGIAADSGSILEKAHEIIHEARWCFAQH